MSDALVVLRKVEYLGCIAFKRLANISTQDFCEVCGKVTISHLVDAKDYFAKFDVIYRCCDRQDCYDESIKQMQQDYYLFACQALTLLEKKNGKFTGENAIDSVGWETKHSML